MIYFIRPKIFLLLQNMKIHGYLYISYANYATWKIYLKFQLLEINDDTIFAKISQQYSLLCSHLLADILIRCIQFSNNILKNQLSDIKFNPNVDLDETIDYLLGAMNISENQLHNIKHNPDLKTLEAIMDKLLRYSEKNPEFIQNKEYIFRDLYHGVLKPQGYASNPKKSICQNMQEYLLCNLENYKQEKQPKVLANIKQMYFFIEMIYVMTSLMALMKQLKCIDEVKQIRSNICKEYISERKNITTIDLEHIEYVNNWREFASTYLTMRKKINDQELWDHFPQEFIQPMWDRRQFIKHEESQCSLANDDNSNMNSTSGISQCSVANNDNLNMNSKPGIKPIQERSDNSQSQQKDLIIYLTHNISKKWSILIFSMIMLAGISIITFYVYQTRKMKTTHTTKNLDKEEDFYI